MRVAQVVGNRLARKNVAECAVEEPHPERNAHAAFLPGGEHRIHVGCGEALAREMVDRRRRPARHQAIGGEQHAQANFVGRAA